MTEAPLLVVGVMSGTSLDGVDAAIVRIHGPTRIALKGFAHRPYSAAERGMIEHVLAGASVRDTARLHVALSEWAADAIDVALELSHVRADTIAAIAMHGQTVWHEPPLVSWQLGEPAVLAERFGVRVVHNFRARDVAAGGQGAPLVAIADALCFGAADHARLLLNLGGMANVTRVERQGDLDQVVASDTGPGMAIIDTIARLLDPAADFDRDGRAAATGVVNDAVLQELLGAPFFSAPLPRSTGREHFGREYAERLHARLPGADGVRTAVALTVESVARCCATQLAPAAEMVVSGGGAHHPVLMQSLTERMATIGVRVARFDDLFFSGDAKEAVAFALLGWLSLHGQPGNLPAVTGAAGDRVLGCITPA
jgi:anhydro-N-acetylmuramic acid kinase